MVIPDTEIWVYHAYGWTHESNPIPRVGSYAEYQEKMDEFGYRLITCTLPDDYPLALYTRWSDSKATVPYRWLAEIQLGDEIIPLFIPDLPDLLAFLQQYVPVLEAFGRVLDREFKPHDKTEEGVSS